MTMPIVQCQNVSVLRPIPPACPQLFDSQLWLIAMPIVQCQILTAVHPVPPACN